jgi:hypothetical protein
MKPLIKALFSNFVAIDYKIGLNDSCFFIKLKQNMRKELAHLIPNYKMAFYHVKIGFRILTIFFTKTVLIKNHPAENTNL